MNVRFKTDDGKIDPELFSSKAEQFAKEVYKGQTKTNGKANKPTQLRKFYDEVLRFDGILKSCSHEKQKEEFEKLLPYLKMLNAKVAYAMGRDLVTEEFRDFISQSINQIESRDDFDIFASLFEAFMGFYKYYDEQKGENLIKEQSKGGHKK